MNSKLDNHLDKLLAFGAMLAFVAASIVVVHLFPQNTVLLTDMHDGLVATISIFSVLVYPRGKGDSQPTNHVATPTSNVQGS